jgi:hypothetical protein
VQQSLNLVLKECARMARPMPSPGSKLLFPSLYRGITTMLLCSFASPRSRPEKIERWIDYLQMLGERHGHDPESARLIEQLLAKARSWGSESYQQVSAESVPH